jgi:hypothetical protein
MAHSLFLIAFIQFSFLPHILQNGAPIQHTRRQAHAPQTHTRPTPTHLPTQLVQEDKLAQHHARHLRPPLRATPRTHHAPHAAHPHLVRRVLLLHGLRHHRRLPPPLEPPMLLRAAAAAPIPRVRRGRRHPGQHTLVERESPRTPSVDGHDEGSLQCDARPVVLAYRVDGAE